MRTTIVVAWIVTAIAGLAGVAMYKSTANLGAHAPIQWPGTIAVPAPSGCTMLVFLHPHCPCSRASLAELTRLLTRCQGAVHTTIFMVRPDDVPPGWEESDLWRMAKALPGITVLTDADGVEAQRFGVKTSGQVLLYAADQRLVYTGGITAARGHEGDNDGRSILSSLILGTGSDGALATNPVFGCSLQN